MFQTYKVYKDFSSSNVYLKLFHWLICCFYSFIKEIWASLCFKSAIKSYLFFSSVVTGEQQEVVPTRRWGPADNNWWAWWEGGGEQRLQELHLTGHPCTDRQLRQWTERRVKADPSSVCSTTLFKILYGDLPPCCGKLFPIFVCFSMMLDYVTQMHLWSF